MLHEHNWQVQKVNYEAKSRCLAVLQFFILLFFTLFDFYKSGFRIFDIAAFILILLFISSRISLKWIGMSALALISITGVYAIGGLIFNQIYPTIIALFFNSTLFCLLTIKELKPSQKQIKIVITIHLSFFLLQFLYFYATGSIVNFHSFTDIEPRLESAIFRPAGLFYEPAIYCFAVFILISMLETKNNKYGMLESLAMASMVISVSLLGLFFAALIFVRLIINRKFIGPILSLLPILFINNDFLQTMLAFVENRVSDLKSDASADDRYGNIVDLFSSENLIYHLIGRGFGAGFEQFGSSGASAAISSVGIFGFAFFSCWLLFRSKELAVGFLSLVAIIISAPIFSYGIFPYWIANVVYHSKRLKISGWRRNKNNRYGLELQLYKMQ